MMNHNLIDALDSCIRLMEAGTSFEDCLAIYPKLAPKLRGLLQTADELNDLWVEQIPVKTMTQNRIQLISHAHGLLPAKKQGLTDSINDWLSFTVRQLWQSIRPVSSRLILALAITGIFILFSGGLLRTSAKSLPGDSLYPVKRAVEDIRVYLAPNHEVQHEYEEEYSQQRVDEVTKLMGLAREQQISFEGIVISMNDSQWIVSGIPVNILPDTIFVTGAEGTIEPGMRVEVEGKTNLEGRVSAHEIHLREYQFVGIVENITSRNWLISGISVLTSSSTQIDTGILVGDEVTVLIRSEDKALFALAILRELHARGTSTAIPFPMITLTPLNDEIDGNDEEQQMNGILEKVGLNYWVVSGEVYYIIGETHIDADINIGDYVSIKYLIESNGSFTAIEISKSDGEETPVEEDKQGIPEAPDGEDHSTGTVTPTEDDDFKENAQTYEPSATPEPPESTQTYEPTETPKPPENTVNPN